jgi:hypothetical protein
VLFRSDRFRGAKTSIHVRGEETIRSDSYGEWDILPVDMSFCPMPKRAYIRPDNTLAIRLFTKGEISTPYSKGLKSPESVMLEAVETQMIEQPDADYLDIGYD